MTIRVGVLGAGRIGRIHCASIKALSDKAQLVAVCDPMLDDDWAQTQKIPHATRDEREFFDLDLDAVIIASPTTKHFDHVMRALTRNLHVLCEKPIDMSLAPHFAIKEAWQKTKCKLQIGFNRRFDDDFNNLALRTRQGEIGRPYLVRITSRDPGLPSLEYLKSSGGMFLDMTIHDFDMARYVMNSDVVEVFAYGARLVDPNLAVVNDIDTAVIVLTFANGAFGVIDNSRQSIYGYDQRVEIFGSGGSFANDHHRPSSVVKYDVNGSHQEPMLHFFLERYQSSYVQEMDAFLHHIVNDTDATPSIDDAIAAMKLALCAQESLVSQKPIAVERV